MRVKLEADSGEIMGTWPVVDEGDYGIVCVEKTDGITKEKITDDGKVIPGKPKVDLRFEIKDSDGAKIGSCFHTITFIQKGQPGHGFMLTANKAMGMPFDGSLDYDTDEYVGKTAKAHIIVNTYNGNTNNKIGNFITNSDDVVPF